MDKPALLLKFICAIAAAGLIYWALSEDLIIGGGPGLGLVQLFVLACGLGLLLACITSHKITVGISSIFVSSAVSLTVAELTLRAFLAPGFVTAFEADPRYHYKLRPGADREFQHAAINGGEKITYHVNSNGFRGGELLRDAGNGRIVVYGDSFIQAEFSALENTFTHQLAQLLGHKLGEELEVINAGVAGYGPDQIYKKLSDELPQLQPDLAVVAIFAGNDFGDLIRNKMYLLDEAGVVASNDYSVSEDIMRGLALARHQSIIKLLLGRAKEVLAGSAAESDLPPVGERLERYARQHIEEYRQYVIDHDNVVRELLSDPYSADISLYPTSDSAAYKIKLMNAVVGKIKAAAQKNNVPLMTLIIPHPMDLLDGAHDSGKVDRIKYPGYLPSRLTDTLADIMRVQQIEYINLYEKFKQQAPANLYFKGGDDHWNDRGQRLAAEIVSEHLLGKQFYALQ